MMQLGTFRLFTIVMMYSGYLTEKFVFLAKCDINVNTGNEGVMHKRMIKARLC